MAAGMSSVGMPSMAMGRPSMVCHWVPTVGLASQSARA